MDDPVKCPSCGAKNRLAQTGRARCGRCKADLRAAEPLGEGWWEAEDGYWYPPRDPGSNAGVYSSGPSGQTRRQLDEWRKDLIDLTKRNRLLHLPMGKRSSVVRILGPSYQDILKRIASGSRYWLFHYPDVQPGETEDDTAREALAVEDPTRGGTPDVDELLTDVNSAARLSRRLHALERRAKTEFNDKGIRVLYLGVGLLHWNVSDDEHVSPVLLVPVSLERPSPRERFRLHGTDDDAVVNPALTAKLSKDFGIDLPAEMVGGDPWETLQAVRRAIGDQDSWEVANDVVLGVFSFHKEAMYRDLVEHEKAVIAHPMVRALSGDVGSGERFGFEAVPADQLDEVAPPEKMGSILDADSTQRQCIVAARDGRSFVMDGPPGSGKSQTIANMIAELLAERKTILFVSEKAAALDVVKKRLDRAGLGSYVLELHSHKATRKEVARSLGLALEHRPKKRSRLDGGHIERLKNLRRSLSGYSAAQNEVREPLGHSLHWAIGRVDDLTSYAGTPVPDTIDSTLSAKAFRTIVAEAGSLAAAWAPVTNGDDFLWRELSDGRSLQQRLTALGADLETARRDLVELRERATRYARMLHLDDPRSVEDAARTASLMAMAEEHLPVPDTWLSAADLSPIEARVDALEERGEKHADATRVVSRFGGDASSLGAVDLERLEEAIGNLKATVPPLPLDSTWPPEVIFGRIDFLVWLRTQTSALLDGAGSLAASLGLSRPHTISGLQALVEVAQLASQPRRPESWWFDDKALAAASAALQALQPVVIQYRDLREQLAQVFNEQIYLLDVEAFFDGPTDLSPKISRFSSRGRNNRRQLKACTLSGEISDDAVAMLAIVRQWRQVAGQLYVLGEHVAPTLGTHYFRQADTDVAALEEALSVAARAVELTRTTGRSQLLAVRLSRESSEAPGIAVAARTLGEQMGLWLEAVARHLQPIAGVLRDMPLDEIGDWVDQVHAPSTDLVEVLRRVLDVVPIDSIGQALTLLDARVRCDQIAESFTEDADDDSRILGELYRGLSSDWSTLREGLAWATTVREFLGGPCSAAQALAILTAGTPASELDEPIRNYRKHIAWIEDMYQPAQGHRLRRDLEDLDDASELLTALAETTSQVDVWVAHEGATSSLAELGVSQVVAHLVAERVDPTVVVPTIEAVVLRAWIDSVIASDERIRPILSADRDRVVDQFRSLDRSLIAHGAERAIEAGNARRPTTATGEVAVIKREAEKKTRHRPIKTLLEDAGRTAQQLTPCFMMSPLSVSQFLPGDLGFDVVIFDEASQVRPSDAMNAIYRGRQLIVAGDNRQLPPTSFFDRMEDDGDAEYDEDTLDVFESVLDLCRSTAGVPELPLRWHYRSRHESLITYSNRAFYEGKLVTYPGAFEHAPDLGVELFHVDGVYERGGARDNPIEAQAVVDRVVFHAENHPELTCGVVAFSEAQATRIEREIETMRRRRPDLESYFHGDRLDGFFVKNLENVQGDERDVIIFSVGYGPDENGKTSMNFGPLNREGGQRRLNVAITRARRRVEVVSSIRARDVRETPSLGVRHLKGYLDFAERGADALSPVELDSDAEPESPFEESVLGVLRSWGHDVVPQVGQAGYRIDMGVRDPKHPGRFLLGIECDGAAYHSSPVARDRDRLRQEVLEDLGWRLHRIWGPSWYRDRGGEERRLREVIERSLDEQMPARPTPKPTHVEVEVEHVDLDGRPEWVQDYQAARLPARRGSASFDRVEMRADLEDDIVAIVRIEGPVVDKLVLQRLRERWNVKRMTADLRDVFSKTVDRLVATGVLNRSLPRTLRLPGQATDVVRAPTEGRAATLRKASEVPEGELVAALVGVVRDSTRIDEDELQVQVARIFGWNRRGSEIVSALSSALEAAIARGLLVRSPDGMVSPRRG